MTTTDTTMPATPAPEPEDGPQKLYRVTVRRDAWVNYTADIKATSPEEAADIATQAWKTGEPEIKFDEDGLQEFDHIECDADDGDVEEITDQEDETPSPAVGDDAKTTRAVLKEVMHWIDGLCFGGNGQADAQARDLVRRLSQILARDDLGL